MESSDRALLMLIVACCFVLGVTNLVQLWILHDYSERLEQLEAS